MANNSALERGRQKRHDQLSAESQYVLGELEHFIAMGMTAWEMEAALGRKMSTLARLASRHGRPDLAHPFYLVMNKQVTERKQAAA